MSIKSLLIFSIGGAFVMLVIWGMFVYLALLDHYLETGTLVSFAMIFGFLGFMSFLIVGLDLKSVMRNAK
jgi:hypothetical protein